MKKASSKSSSSSSSSDTLPTVDAMVGTFLRYRLRSDEAATAAALFLSVYMAHVSRMYSTTKGSTANPQKRSTDWLSLKEASEGHTPALIDVSARASLHDMLVRIGFSPVVEAGTNKITDVKFPAGKTPSKAWKFAVKLIKMHEVIDAIDKHAVRIKGLAADYIGNVNTSSAEHFAMAWLVGPYLNAIMAAGVDKADATVKCSSRTSPEDPLGAACVIDPLTVALKVRDATVSAAKKLWKTSASVNPEANAWTSIATLFGRLGFPQRSDAEAILRFKRAKKETPGIDDALIKLAGFDVPATHAERVGIVVALPELHDAHQARHAAAEGHVYFEAPAVSILAPHDSVVAELFAAAAPPSTGYGCCNDDDDARDICAAQERSYSEQITALETTIMNLLAVVSIQRNLIEKAKEGEAKSDKNDAQIIAETAALRGELDILRAEANGLRQAAETSAADAAEAARLAETYRKSYEETLARLEEARRNVSVAGPTSRPPTAPSMVPPPPPPPPLPKQSTGVLADKAKETQTLVRAASERMKDTEEDIDAKLDKVQNKASANAAETSITLRDLQMAAQSLRKVDAAASTLAEKKGDDQVVVALRAALAKISRVTTGDIDKEVDDEGEVAFDANRYSALYFMALLDAANAPDA